ncbi:hypothetical protein FB563_1865 [Streptomyces puniciscabiei]|uniref:Uncharacterized protein n=1 Tax=Streptomyces puniciscabiei TaxID=164348 RepID=A0A542UCV2_9ACTN|nr:hypothetical protein FB563_1865 [Streptomyces puniciscabiei]
MCGSAAWARPAATEPHPATARGPELSAAHSPLIAASMSRNRQIIPNLE